MQIKFRSNRPKHSKRRNSTHNSPPILPEGGAINAKHSRRGDKDLLGRSGALPATRISEAQRERSRPAGDSNEEGRTTSPAKGAKAPPPDFVSGRGPRATLPTWWAWPRFSVSVSLCQSEWERVFRSAGAGLGQAGPTRSETGGKRNSGMDESKAARRHAHHHADPMEKGMNAQTGDHVRRGRHPTWLVAFARLVARGPARRGELRLRQIKWSRRLLRWSSWSGGKSNARINRGRAA